ncbi:MAG: sporulation protein YabP [Oscillospiraceae bacterium]|jgi:sporulation protein YabP|nr:sporulation protein YabP [Oscillospiraceae bacterium]
MIYDEKHKAPEAPHNVILENRRKAAVSGVDDVESFDENEISMSTSQGSLILRGHELRIEKLSLDSGDVTVEGVVDSFEYVNAAKPQGGLLSRLFR